MIFLDTSGLLILADTADKRHSAALELCHVAGFLLTHNYVLCEFVALAHARRLPSRKSLEFLLNLQKDPMVNKHWVDEDLHAAGMLLLRRRKDKQYSLCDAVSFVLMKDKGLSEALTTDHHFEQEGFIRLLKD